MPLNAARDFRPYNALVRLGLWSAVLSSILWERGRLSQYIEADLPYAIGVESSVMIVGLVIRFRKPKTPVMLAGEKEFKRP